MFAGKLPALNLVPMPASYCPTLLPFSFQRRIGI